MKQRTTTAALLAAALLLLPAVGCGTSNSGGKGTDSGPASAIGEPAPGAAGPSRAFIAASISRRCATSHEASLRLGFMAPESTKL